MGMGIKVGVGGGSIRKNCWGKSRNSKGNLEFVIGFFDC